MLSIEELKQVFKEEEEKANAQLAEKNAKYILNQQKIELNKIRIEQARAKANKNQHKQEPKANNLTFIISYIALTGHALILLIFLLSIFLKH